MSAFLPYPSPLLPFESGGRGGILHVVAQWSCPLQCPKMAMCPADALWGKACSPLFSAYPHDSTGPPALGKDGEDVTPFLQPLKQRSPSLGPGSVEVLLCLLTAPQPSEASGQERSRSEQWVLALLSGAMYPEATYGGLG